MFFSGYKRLIVFPIFFVFLLSGVSAEDSSPHENLEALFSSSQGRPYRNIKEDIRTLFNTLDEEGIPSGILYEKLKEGAAKRVPEKRLLIALKQEEKYIMQARSLMDDTGYPGDGWGEDRTALLKAEVILLRNGLDSSLVESVLRAGKKAELSASEVRFLLNTVFQIQRITQLDKQQLIELSEVLSASNIPPSMYESLPSVFLKTQLYTLGDSEMLRLVIHVLQGGGGMIQIQQELSRRTRIR